MQQPQARESDIKMLIQSLKSAKRKLEPRDFADEAESRTMHDYAYERSSTSLVWNPVSVPKRWARWRAQRKLARLGPSAVPLLVEELTQPDIDEDFQERVTKLLVRQAEAGQPVLDQLRNATHSPTVSNRLHAVLSRLEALERERGK
ncbi:MAG: hypothetical protein WD696_15180 [Bryobacteraceae bacterium]